MSNLVRRINQEKINDEKFHSTRRLIRTESERKIRDDLCKLNGVNIQKELVRKNSELSMSGIIRKTNEKKQSEFNIDIINNTTENSKNNYMKKKKSFQIDTDNNSNTRWDFSSPSSPGSLCSPGSSRPGTPGSPGFGIPGSPFGPGSPGFSRSGSLGSPGFGRPGLPGFSRSGSTSVSSMSVSSANIRF